jgi:hypothetical protein
MIDEEGSDRESQQYRSQVDTLWKQHYRVSSILRIDFIVAEDTCGKGFKVSSYVLLSKSCESYQLNFS